MGTRTRVALLVLVTVATMALGGRAQARLPDEDPPYLDEGTALTLGARVLKVGILAFDYGITNRINIGTDPPAWAVSAAVGIILPNLHLKVIAYHSGPLWLTGQVAGYYAIISGDTTSGSVVVVPLTAFASYELNPSIWLHTQAAYNFIEAFGSGDISRTTLGGSATARSAQIGVMGEYRLRPEISLTLSFRLQVYTGKLIFDGTSDPDAATVTTVNAQLTPRDDFPWMIVPGVAFLWPRVRLSVGAGYGNYFVPGLNIALSGKGFVPQASLAVIF